MGEQGRLFDDRLNPLDVMDKIGLRIQQVFPGAQEIQPQLPETLPAPTPREPPEPVWQSLGYPESKPHR